MILVFLEQRDGVIKKASLEAVRAASTVAHELATTVTAVVCGNAGSLEQIGGYGAAKVLHVNDERLNGYSTTAYAKCLKDIAEKEQARIVFMSATAMGKDLAPRLGVKLDGAVVADVTALKVVDGVVVATRPVFAGKALTSVSVNTQHQIYSLRPNVFTAGIPNGSVCPVDVVSVELTDADFSVKATGTKISSEKLDVAEASVIVSGGRGLQAPEHWHLIEELASVLGGATGASRAVVDAGWRPHPEQVGQTGKTVSPSLYVACGISGAVQHLAGMSTSKVIVAINKDKDAPIFQVADYGIIGDAFEILPALTQELKTFFGK